MMRYYFTKLTNILFCFINDKVSIVRSYGKWTSFILLVGVKLAQPFWREIWDVYLWPFNPAFLSMYNTGNLLNKLCYIHMSLLKMML